MDINQKRLKFLVDDTDSAFGQYKQHPTSENYAQAYEKTKSALDHFKTEIRLSMQ
jgi:hypothetical protein